MLIIYLRIVFVKGVNHKILWFLKILSQNLVFCKGIWLHASRRLYRRNLKKKRAKFLAESVKAKWFTGAVT